MDRKVVAMSKIMELADAYGESRHVNGSHTYNARTADARKALQAEVEAVSADNERLKEERNKACDNAITLVFACNDLEAERDTLRAEVERLQVDAERHRWLRDNSAYVAANPHARTCLWVLRGVFEIPGQGFDAAIDLARSKT